MATKVELQKELIKAALEQAASLRSRNATAATNPVIKQAYEEEERAIRDAIPRLETIPEPRK